MMQDRRSDHKRDRSVALLLTLVKALVVQRNRDEKPESISDREGDCHRDCNGAWHLTKRAMSSCIEKRAMLNLVSTPICLVLSLAHVAYGCPPLRAVDVHAVCYLLASSP